MSLRRLVLCTALLAAPLLGCGSDGPSGPTDSADVEMRSSSFAPSTVRLNVNGTVRWRNTSGVAHTSTGNNNTWDSGTVAVGGTFSRQFPTAGTFSYRCTLHANMTGTVIVQ